MPVAFNGTSLLSVAASEKQCWLGLAKHEAALHTWRFFHKLSCNVKTYLGPDIALQVTCSFFFLFFFFSFLENKCVPILSTVKL